jgi:hypothetical protein
VARLLSRQVRAARLTPKARSFQFKAAFSTEGLAPPTPHPWPPRALAPIVAAALVARPNATHGITGAANQPPAPRSANVRGRTRTYTDARERSLLADPARPSDARRGPSLSRFYVHECSRTTTNVRGQSLSPQAEAPSLTLTADSITDAQTGHPIQADVYVNDALLFEGVTHFQVTVPLDGSAEIHVTAPGYKPWGIRPRGEGTDKALSGPIRLTPE